MEIKSTTPRNESSAPMGSVTGTGLAPNLSRIDRTQRAEKLANEAPVKLIFPLVACIFPTVFIVLFSPILYRCSSGDF